MIFPKGLEVLDGFKKVREACSSGFPPPVKKEELLISSIIIIINNLLPGICSLAPTLTEFLHSSPHAMAGYVAAFMSYICLSFVTMVSSIYFGALFLHDRMLAFFAGPLLPPPSRHYRGVAFWLLQFEMRYRFAFLALHFVVDKTLQKTNVAI